MSSPSPQSQRAPWRETLRVVIFEADSPAGKVFDVALLVTIVLSVSVVMAESVAGLRDRYGLELKLAEWTFTTSSPRRWSGRHWQPP